MTMRILFMGPMPEPYHGQSVAFSTVVNQMIKAKKVKYTIIDISNSASILKGINLCLKIIYYMMRYRYDVVYFTCSRSFTGSIRDVVLLILSKINNPYIVNHLHGGDFKIFYINQPTFYKKILGWSYRSVDISIVLLDKMKDQFDCFPKMKIKVVPNCYSSSFDILSQKKEFRNGIQLIYMSNIMKSKGIINLLLAFEYLLKNNIACDMKLLIAGLPISDYISSAEEVSKEFQELFGRIKKDYPDQIEYCGVLTGKDKVKALWNSDIFILPTFYKTEASPISIVEAMRAGNYIISTKHNYIPDIIGSKNGQLIKPNSVDEISFSLINAISDMKHLNLIQNNNILVALDKYRETKYIENILKIIHISKQKN